MMGHKARDIKATMMLLIIVLLAMATAVHGDPPPDVNLNHRLFADTLVESLYKNENECTSTLGISMAFSLIYPSASGDALEQIRDVMRFPAEHRQLVWNETSARLDAAYEGGCLDTSSFNGECNRQRPLLEIANSVWIDNEFNLNTEYSEVVGDFVRQIAFQEETAGGIVNNWVNASTKGLIDSIIREGPLFPPYILLAVNSIYLKASWDFQFTEFYTNEDVFYTDSSRSTAVAAPTQFMHQVESFPYSDEVIADFQVVQLPMAESHLSMILVLPLVPSAERVSSVDLIAALPQLVSTRLALALPKFKFKSTYGETLEDSLKEIGLQAPFSGGLCVREGSCGAFIDLVIQKTFIDVNEKGVEAAAVTLIGVVESAGPLEEPPPKLVMADHPFQFFIYDSVEEVMIFEGRVGNPGIADDAPAAQLQAKHGDNFWMSTFNVDPQVVLSGSTNGTPPPTDSPSGTVSIHVELAMLLTLLMVFTYFVV